MGEGLFGYGSQEVGIGMYTVGDLEVLVIGCARQV